MTDTIYTSEYSDLRNTLGKPLRTKGCILIFCISGYAVLESNFTRKPFRQGCLAVIFSDTLFSVVRVSRDFKVIKFELSLSLTDEVTYISSGPFFDWLDDNQVCIIPQNKVADLRLWYDGMKWIENNAEDCLKNAMLHNQWQNFFLGFESVVKPWLDTRDMKTISSSRRLFHKFCQLLCENCRTHHDVKFYADKLCITPYYLSKITFRIFQVSPKELIDRQLIMEVKALLTTSDMTVKEIADRYCFDSASYLGRYFRRHVGMTPLDYREQQTNT